MFGASSMRKKIFTDQAPEALGPYSQAIAVSGQNLLFISGQIPLNPQSMKVESDNVIGQTKQVLKNLEAILYAAQTNVDAVVKTTVYLKNIDDFVAVNAEYEKFFADHKPARVCVEVARLPKDVLVEIDAIAVF
jgi:2-iminobutanoate/2-iminopropanoate deaminase